MALRLAPGARAGAVLLFFAIAGCQDPPQVECKFDTDCGDPTQFHCQQVHTTIRPGYEAWTGICRVTQDL